MSVRRACFPSVDLGPRCFLKLPSTCVSGFGIGCLLGVLVVLRAARRKCIAIPASAGLPSKLSLGPGPLGEQHRTGKVQLQKLRGVALRAL